MGGYFVSSIIMRRLFPQFAENNFSIALMTCIAVAVIFGLIVARITLKDDAPPAQPIHRPRRPVMTKRGDTALFHGVLAGFLGYTLSVFILPVILPQFMAGTSLVPMFICTLFGLTLAITVGYASWRRSGRPAELRSAGRCTKCGYDLRGLTEPRCPECWTPFTPEDMQDKDGDS